MAESCFIFAELLCYAFLEALFLVSDNLSSSCLKRFSHFLCSDLHFISVGPFFPLFLSSFFWVFVISLVFPFLVAFFLGLKGFSFWLLISGFLLRSFAATDQECRKI